MGSYFSHEAPIRITIPPKKETWTLIEKKKIKKKKGQNPKDPKEPKAQTLTEKEIIVVTLETPLVEKPFFTLPLPLPNNIDYIPNLLTDHKTLWQSAFWAELPCIYQKCAPGKKVWIHQVEKLCFSYTRVQLENENDTSYAIAEKEAVHLLWVLLQIMRDLEQEYRRDLPFSHVLEVCFYIERVREWWVNQL